MPPMVARIDSFVAEHASFRDTEQVNQNYKRCVPIILGQALKPGIKVSGQVKSKLGYMERLDVLRDDDVAAKFSKRQNVCPCVVIRPSLISELMETIY